MSISPCINRRDIDAVTTHHESAESGLAVSRVDLAGDHFRSSIENAKNAAGHAIGTVVVPVAAAAMFPVALVPYAGLFYLMSLPFAASYVLTAPLMAAGESYEALAHAATGIRTLIAGHP